MNINTISQESNSKMLEQRSVFYGYLIPINSEDKVKKIAEQIKKKHKNANHVAYAYRILDEKNQVNERSSDDGEPSKTAGFPLLRMLQHKDLLNTVLLVARVFGGIKLGTSGLIKAYGTAGLMAIKNASIKRGPICKLKRLTIPLESLSKAELFLNSKKLRFDKNFIGSFVTLNIQFPVDKNLQEEFNNAIR